MSDESNSPVATRILIVEDEMIVAQHLALILKDIGYQVVGMASTGALAIQLAEESKPALVLMDVNLPGEIDGIEASEQIRARLDIPVVFLSAYDEKDVLHRAKKAEPYGYIAKPFSKHILKITIETALYKHGSDKRVRESEERFRKVFEQGPIGMGLVGTHGQFLVANSQLCQMLGYTEDELTRLTFVDITHPDHVTQDLEAVRRLYAGEIPYYKAEKRYIKKDGDILWGNLTAAVIRDEEGKLLYALPMIEDVTDRKRAEEALQQSEKQYRDLYENMRDAVASVSMEGKITEFNAAFQAMLGYTRQEIFERTYEDITPAKWHALEAAIIERQVLKRGYSDPYEKEYVRRDGIVVPIELTTYLATDDLGKPAGMWAIVKDITERKKAEQELQFETQRLRVLSENAPFGMVMISKEGVFEYVNPKFKEIFGYDLSDVPNGREWFRKAYPDDAYRHETIAAWKEDLEGLAPGGTRSRVFEVTCKDGSRKTIHFRPVKLDTGEDLMTCEDISYRIRAENDLRDSEARYRLIVENTHDLIMVTEPDGIISYLSPSCYRVLGYDPEELKGKQPWIIHPDDINQVRELFSHALKGSSGTDIEYRIETREGQTRWISHSWSPIFRDGKLVSIISVLRNITEHKRADEALQIKDNAMTSSISGIAIGDFAGNVIYVNPAVLSLWGYEHESEIVGKPIRKFWLVNEKAEAAWKAAAKTGYWIGELVALKRDGSSADFQVAVSLLRKRDGKPMAIMGSFMDITDRKRAEQALRESEEKYRTLFEESIDAVYITTREGLLVDANQAFLDLFGFSTEESRNMEIVQIYTDAAHRKRFQEEIERKGSLKDYGVSFRKKDGTKIEGLLTSTVRLDDDGTILGYQGIIRDVSEQRKLQSQLLQAQKMEAVGTLAGGIAHDFNNLLQAILGYSEILLMKKEADDPDRKKLEVIQHAARDGADLVSRILAFSKKSESKVRPIDLNQELRRIERLLRRTLPQMIKIDLVLSDDLRIIDADPAQIEQVLLNLAVNAQHAMPDGGQLLIETRNVSISDEYLRTHLQARKGKYVLLTVSDTGTGMTPEVMERIFEPFFTTKINGEGTGLGLSMVHGIVIQHGGYIRCYSEHGRGTSFKIYLPVSKTEGLWDLAETREMPAFGTETILLVDDDDRVRDMAQQMIEMGGYKVITAINGEEALEIYGRRGAEIALVILDLIMPGAGGKRCLEDVLRVDPDARVIIASGLSNGLASENVTGSRGFVMKPYDAKEILRAIRKVLDQGHL